MENKPNFALNLSENRVEFLHRRPDGDGWDILSAVALDSDTLADDLKALRKMAVDLDGDIFTTKLILPASQLLYATCEDAARDTIAALLHDRTPYSIEAVAYDTCGKAPNIKLVAVARETLDEAQGFLAPYMLNPVGFTAIPKTDQFDREPNLGPARGVEDFQTDAKAVSIYEAPKVESVEDKSNLKLESPDDTSKQANDAQQKPILDAKPAPEKSISETSISEKPVSEKPVSEKPVSEKPVPTASKADAQKTDVKETIAPEVAAKLDIKEPVGLIGPMPKITAPKITPPKTTAPEITPPEPEIAAKAPPITAPVANKPVANKPVTAKPAAQKPAPTIIRKAPSEPMQTETETPKPDALKPEKPMPEKPMIARPEFMAKVSADAPKFSTDRPYRSQRQSRILRDALPAQDIPKIGGNGRSVRTNHLISGHERGAPPISRKTIGTHTPRPKLEDIAALGASKPNAQANSGFDLGGLSARRPIKPVNRTGLYVTAAGLAFVALLVTGIAIMLPGGGTRTDEMVAAAPETETEIATTDTQALQPAVIPDADEAERLALQPKPNDDAPQVAQTGATDAQDATPTDLTTTDLATTDRVTAQFDTGVAAQNPPVSTLPVARADLAGNDAQVAPPGDLPVQAERLAGNIAAPQLPPPPGARFTLNDRGLVVPEADGAQTPDGALIFAGTPDQTPGWRDGSTVPEPLPETQLTDSQIEDLNAETEQTRAVIDTAEDGNAADTADINAADPDAPQTDTDQTEIANLGSTAADASLAGIARDTENTAAAAPQSGIGSTAAIIEQPEDTDAQTQPNPELAEIRPTERPASLAEQVRNREQSEAILKAVEEAAREAALAAPPADTTLAGFRPISRPPGLSQLAARIKESNAAQQSASASTAPVQQASGPAVASASRAIASAPTRTSVAKAATQKKVVPLGKLALIGVFGKEQARRALVRMPNGQFQRVSVGDSFNGGRVAAIGDQSLRYSKGSRLLILEMPKG